MGNIVIAAEIVVVSEQPLLATLTLHTLEGQTEFSVNQSAAEALLGVLTKFLNGTDDHS